MAEGVKRHQQFKTKFTFLDVDELNTHSKSHNTVVTPAVCVADQQSGTLVERNGEWRTAVNDTLYLYLSALIPYTYALGKAKIESITVYYNTEANGDYINSVILESYNPLTGAFVTEWSDPDDQGNGTSGRDNNIYNPNYVLEAGLAYCFQVAAVVGTTRVDIYAIKIEWRLVINTTPDGQTG